MKTKLLKYTVIAITILFSNLSYASKESVTNTLNQLNNSASLAALVGKNDNNSVDIRDQINNSVAIGFAATRPEYKNKVGQDQTDTGFDYWGAILDGNVCSEHIYTNFNSSLYNKGNADAKVKIGYVFANASINIVPYVDIGYGNKKMFTSYVIGRDARNNAIWSSPYKCQCEGFRLLGGVMFQIPIANEMLLSPYVAIGTGFKVEFLDEKLNVNTGASNRLAYEAGLDFNMRLSDKLFINVFTNYNHLNLKSGNVLQGNKFTQLKAGIGLRYSFL